MILSSLRSSFTPAYIADSSCLSAWGVASENDVSWLAESNSPIVVDALTSLKWGVTSKSGIVIGVVVDNLLVDVDVTTSMSWVLLNAFNVSISYPVDNTLTDLSLTTSSTWDYIPTKEISFLSPYAKVRVNGEPLNDAIHPVELSTKYPYEVASKKDLSKRFNYGYSINRFLVGGVVKEGYLIDEEATVEPPKPGDPGEVIHVVNIVNIVTLPDRTPIKFTNLTMALDVDSVAWVVNFDVADAVSFGLVKPVGMTVKEVEVTINSETFVFFVGRTRTRASVDSNRAVKKVMTCTGWSNIKRLSYPYSAKRSHVEISQATPAGIITSELTGTGFNFLWDTVSWTIPANVFSYMNKAPLAAILDLVKSVGAIVTPSQNTDFFTVSPRYPVSPWHWSTAVVDFNLSENSFFSMDTEWVPKEAPDSVYVYGEEGGGVGVKCVKSGTAGLKTLPTIVDKHITDTIAGTERGRIEIAKNGFKESIPVSTYVDVVGGIIKPLKLVEVTEAGGGTWRGMVTKTGVSISRNGNAVTQSLIIERHYE